MLQMHEWESQEKILTTLELQDVENCLSYKDFQYQRHEWDNIPIIVPRYIIYLSKYINGLTRFCKKAEESETTASLRADIDSKYQLLKADCEHKRGVDLEEKGQISGRIEELKAELEVTD